MKDLINTILLIPQGFLDYAFIIITIFLCWLLILVLINDGLDQFFEAIFPVAFAGAIILGPIYYFNNIPPGNYLAKTIKINDKKVGTGTNEDELIKLDFEKEKIKMIGGYKDFGVKRLHKEYFYLNKEKSNFYTRTYFDAWNRETLRMSLLGYIKIYKENPNTNEEEVKYVIEIND